MSCAVLCSSVTLQVLCVFKLSKVSATAVVAILLWFESSFDLVHPVSEQQNRLSCHCPVWILSCLNVLLRHAVLACLQFVLLSEELLALPLSSVDVTLFECCVALCCLV